MARAAFLYWCAGASEHVNGLECNLGAAGRRRKHKLHYLTHRRGSCRGSREQAAAASQAAHHTQLATADGLAQQQEMLQGKKAFKQP